MHTKTTWLGLAGIVSLTLLAFTISGRQKPIPGVTQAGFLTISGQPGGAQVIEIQGRKYVEVEGLTRIVNGSIGFSGNDIVLTLPARSDADSNSGSTAAAPGAGLTKDFLVASIEAMSQAREWHAALKNAIEHSYPISEDWIGPLRRQAQEGLGLAKVAASSDADKLAFPLFANQFNNTSRLSDKYVQMAKNVNYIAQNALTNDPLEQKLMACGHFLVTILSSGQLDDDDSCR